MSGESQFRVELEPGSDSPVVLALQGEADIYAAPEFKRALDLSLERGASELIVDLARVSFIDSAALGVLVAGVQCMRGRDGAVAVVCDKKNIIRILEVTGLDRIFTLCPTREAASRALAEQASD